MKRKIRLLLCVILLSSVILGYYSLTTGILLGFVVSFILISIVITKKVYIKLNNILKRTNWWNNQFIYTRQFVTNSGYRDCLIRNYDIVNLGSNPALYGFYYEKIKGQNWSTGSQGLDMDYEILRHYHSYIKDGGTVLIPIMPFTAISPYISTKQGYWDERYYQKFARILDWQEAAKLPFSEERALMLNYPLKWKPKSWKYAIWDEPLDNSLNISEQSMMAMELMQDAEFWISCWKKEFDLCSLTDAYSEKWNEWESIAKEQLTKIVDFCLEREYKPVFVCVPMTRYLSDRLKPIHQRLVVDFVDKINIHNIPFFDYTYDVQLQNESLYINSFFLNLKGRKLFTNRVLKDLSLI